ncbi:MAG: DUF4215 domain-containing protein [Deltaproteobacteria bacterium]|nr:DUF4215 domain-containing protein [Deltaproteobacteria bacterium]
MIEVRRSPWFTAVLALFALMLVGSAGTAFAVCGDTIPDAGELCDDGNLVDGDGCDSNCTPTGCGNGIQTLGETCDDGNLVDGDGCDSNCTATGCPNGIATAGEACDDGSFGSATCDPDCTPAACSDGTLNPAAGEQCDDGNVLDADGCDSNCTITSCGNGVLTAGEACDDGNTVDGDGCDSNCTPTACGNGVQTAGESCDDGNVVDGDGCDGNCTATACGNGIVTAPEQCDDGNLVSGDGCDGNCTATACGNGIVTAPEQCDDGNLVNGDGCDSNCTAPGCGNGVVTVPEQCDDGNAVNGDGCDGNCTATGCGNGIQTAGETCDDGNPISGDGCDANCTTTACGNGLLTTGEVCDDGNAASGDGCDTNCTLSGCGNGIIAGTEICDDANLVNGDGCDATCQPTGCGSGAVTGIEQCDDGNLVNGDGCSALCQRELLNMTAAAGDHFGHSVAALATSLIVGAPDVDQPSAINTGRAYLIAGNSGLTLRTFLNPTPGAGDGFGYSVAAVGGDVLVGAPFDDTAGPDAGAVYLFSGASGALLKTFTNPAAGTNDHFGWSIASIDGNILVGAPKDDSGAGGGGVAYLYNSVGVQQVYLNPSPAAGDQFGAAVTALDATAVLIGSPMHDVPANGFNPAADNAGEAYVFEASTGALTRTVANPFPGQGDRFGASVASVAGQALVGSPVNDAAATSAGAAYLFNAGNGQLTQIFVKPGPLVNDEFGYAVTAVGSDKVAVAARRDDTGGPDVGAVYVFDVATGAALQTFQKPVPVTEDHFGNTIASVGSSVFIGAPLDDTVKLDAGAVYSFVDTSCGNGTREGTEACDDGNIGDGDGCDANCTVTGCGNGVVTTGEACDDGNLAVGDGCSPTCTIEGACGDGIQETFEQCDDGNTANGDGCDANCTPTGCGNGIVTVGEQCDEGAANGTNLCCSSACQAVDADLDGVCDLDDNCPTIADPSQLNSDGDVFGNVCDVCPGDVDNDSDADAYCRGALFNPPAVGGEDPCSRPGLAGAWRTSKVRIIRVLAAPEGNEGLRLNGEFAVGSSLPVIAPERHGIQLRITDSANTVLFDVNLPGVVRVPGMDHGWKASGTPASKWIFTDKRPVTVSKGIKKVTVKDLRRLGTAGVFGIFLSHKGGTIPLRDASQLPLRVTVELNDTSLPPGGTPGRDQCGEAAFLPEQCNVLSTNVLCRDRN